MEWLTEIYTDSFGKSRAVLIEPSKGSLCSGCSRDSDDCGDCSLYKAIQKLNALEVAIGGNYDINRLKELVESDRDGRCVVSPCKVGDKLYTIRTIQDGSFTLEVYDSGEIRQISVNTDGTFFLVDYGHSLSANNFGKTVFKTREAAESALKAMKEREEK